jgi:uncharacterized protein
MSQASGTVLWKIWLARIFFLSPFWKRSRWHRVGGMVLRLCYFYVGVLIVLLWLENWFLFTPTTAAEDWRPPPEGLHVEDVSLRSKDGVALHAWWATPQRWQPEDGAVLYCHGSGGNLSGRGEAVKLWVKALRLPVLIVDYPGYGLSEGTPTEAGCYAAGDAAHDWLTKTMGVPGHRIVLLGGSLGGAVATDLAVRRPPRALVLIAAFTSFPDMAQKSYPWLPARWLVRNQMDNLNKIGKVKSPVFIAHGTADSLIPFSQGERLFAAANQPKRFFPMPGRDHDEVPSEAGFTAVRDFLEENDTAFARAD